jgi:hypothetical protein
LVRAKSQVRSSEWTETGRVETSRPLPRIPPQIVFAIPLTAAFGAICVVKLVTAFDKSRAAGEGVLAIFAWVLGPLCALLIVVALVLWAPVLFRSLVMRIQQREGILLVVRPTVGFRSAMSRADPLSRMDGLIQNSSVLITPSEIGVWRGVIHPHHIAGIPLSEIADMTVERGTYRGFRSALIVIRLGSGHSGAEIPLSLAHVWSFGVIGISERRRLQLVKRVSGQVGGLR